MKPFVTTCLMLLFAAAPLFLAQPAAACSGYGACPCMQKPCPCAKAGQHGHQMRHGGGGTHHAHCPCAKGGQHGHHGHHAMTQDAAPDAAADALPLRRKRH